MTDKFFKTGVNANEAGILKHHYDCVAARWDETENLKEIADARAKSKYWQAVSLALAKS
jgi:hypothetical protein